MENEKEPHIHYPPSLALWPDEWKRRGYNAQEVDDAGRSTSGLLDTMDDGTRCYVIHPRKSGAC